MVVRQGSRPISATGDRRGLLRPVAAGGLFSRRDRFGPGRGGQRGSWWTKTGLAIRGAHADSEGVISWPASRADRLRGFAQACRNSPAQKKIGLRRRPSRLQGGEPRAISILDGTSLRVEVCGRTAFPWTQRSATIHGDRQVSSGPGQNSDHAVVNWGGRGVAVVAAVLQTGPPAANGADFDSNGPSVKSRGHAYQVFERSVADGAGGAGERRPGHGREHF